MPPARRRSGHTSAASQPSGQGTLNFGSKSRVSKPAQKSLDIKNEKEKTHPLRSKLSTSPAPIHEIEEPTTNQQPAPASSKSDNVVREQVKVGLQAPKSEEDIEACKLSDVDIRRYWEAEEKRRLIPRGRLLTLPTL